jgi:hypothetical protein
MFGPELMRSFREFKAIWDPDNRMNPGKLVDAVRVYNPIENLRHGPLQPTDGRLSSHVFRSSTGDRCELARGFVGWRNSPTGKELVGVVFDCMGNHERKKLHFVRGRNGLRRATQPG